MSVLSIDSKSVITSKARPILIGILILAMVLIPLAGCSDKKETGSFSYSGALDDKGFWKGVKALNFVEMFDYDAIEIPKDTYTISDESLQSSIDSILASFVTSEQITDRAVVDADTVNIDYVGSVDGVEFEGGNTGGTGTEVEIGVTQYVDNFLEQLIGHTPGETFDINVTFPEDYGNEALNGKAAVFVTTINHIVKKTTPELTDAFVAEKLTTDYGWKTVSEMKDGVRDELKAEAIQNYIGDYLLNKVTVKSIPDTLIEYQENSMKKYYQDSAESYGMEIDEFLTSFAGVTSMEELIESYADTNKQSAQYSLVVQAIAEDAKISVSDDDVATYFKEQMGTEDYSQYEEEYGMPYLKQGVLNFKVMEYLKEHAVLK